MIFPLLFYFHIVILLQSTLLIDFSITFLLSYCHIFTVRITYWFSNRFSTFILLFRIRWFAIAFILSYFYIFYIPHQSYVFVFHLINDTFIAKNRHIRLADVPNSDDCCTDWYVVTTFYHLKSDENINLIKSSVCLVVDWTQTCNSLLIWTLVQLFLQVTMVVIKCIMYWKETHPSRNSQSSRLYASCNLFRFLTCLCSHITSQ